MNDKADREWLQELIVSTARETREELRAELHRVEDRAEQAHHRLRDDLQAWTLSSAMATTKLQGVVEEHARRLDGMERRHPRRQSDPPDADYRIGSEAVKRDRPVTEREFRIVKGTLWTLGAIVVFVWKFLGPAWQWARGLKWL